MPSTRQDTGSHPHGSPVISLPSSAGNMLSAAEKTTVADALLGRFRAYTAADTKPTGYLSGTSCTMVRA